MSTLITSPFPVFTDTDGLPLENGYIDNGVAGLNPISNPKQAYWDQALTIPASAIRTTRGYPARNGAPGFLYISGDFSILISNKNGVVIFSNLNVIDNITVLQNTITIISATVAPHAIVRLTSGAGNWIVPSDVTRIKVTCVGGGGGGGAGWAGTTGGGGGGGGGTNISDISASIINVTPGQAISYSVGVAGAAATAGGDTSFTGAITSGGGGAGASGSAYAGGKGGAPGSGDSGAAGGCGVLSVSGHDGMGGSGGGAGGAGSATSGVNGGTGNYGGGGGGGAGGAGAGTGGAGGSGIIIIEY